MHIERKCGQPPKEKGTSQGAYRGTNRPGQTNATAATEEEAKLREDLRTKREALATAQQATATDKQKLQKLRDVRTRIVAFKAEIARFSAEISVMLEDAGVPTDKRVAFRPVFPEDTEPPLVRREVALNAAIMEREGAPQSPAEGTI